MPGRDIPLVTNEIYHVLNRGTASQPSFLEKRDYLRAQELMRYYQNKDLPFKYSLFNTFSKERKREILEKLKEAKDILVEIISYCFMPNHFHFLLKQKAENGISKFMGNFTNSYTRYFNAKNKRTGALFEGKFKAKRVETLEQLLHLSRYIHLNPYTSYVIKTFEDLKNYPYSSLPEFLGEEVEDEICQKEIILDNFENKEAYQKFIFDQADYQRRLEEIRHLVLEK